MSEKSELSEPISADKSEWRLLPDDPDRMTFRGRYDHVDRAVLDLIHAKDLPQDTQLRVLDFAGGILSFGSPTAHDLEDRIKENGVEAEIDVVDKYIPPDLNPHRPEINYYQSLDSAEGTYDIVRALRLTQFIKIDEYEAIRKNLVAHLKEGGIFISNQGIEFRKYDFDGNYHVPMFAGYNRPIKIMQKRNGVLVPLALLPDTKSPHPPTETDSRAPSRDYLVNYQKWRNDIQSGKAEIVRELHQEGFDLVISELDKDVIVTSRGNGPWDYKKAPEGAKLDQILAENALGTENWFKKAESSATAQVNLPQEKAAMEKRSLFSRLFRRGL